MVKSTVFMDRNVRATCSSPSSISVSHLSTCIMHGFVAVDNAISALKRGFLDAEIALQRLDSSCLGYETKHVSVNSVFHL